MKSRRMRLLTGLLSPFVRGTLSVIQDPKMARIGADALAGLALPPTGCATEIGEVGGVKGLWLHPRDVMPDRAILFFHGGGYVAGSPDTHKRAAGRLALLAGQSVFLPSYRLAPEHPLPAAYEDAVAVWEGMIAEGYAASHITLGGDSAGGGLALSLLSHVCHSSTPPAATFAWSPFTDLTLSGATISSNAHADPFFPAERAVDLVSMILGELEPDDPRVSPLFASFETCPPVHLQMSKSELLYDDAQRMADKLTEIGGNVSLWIEDDAPHVWQLFDDILPEARAAIERTALFVKAHSEASSPSES